MAVAGSGADSLNVQSGAFLFSGPTTGAITLGNFNNGITTGTNSDE